jgi:hypothetical protein
VSRAEAGVAATTPGSHCARCSWARRKKEDRTFRDLITPVITSAPRAVTHLIVLLQDIMNMRGGFVFMCILPLQLSLFKSARPQSHRPAPLLSTARIPSESDFVCEASVRASSALARDPRIVLLVYLLPPRAAETSRWRSDIHRTADSIRT